MKKYITVAALLAAGSAFANADVIVDVAEITNTSATWEVGELTSLSDYWAVQFKIGEEFANTYTQYTLVGLNSKVIINTQVDSGKSMAYLGLKFNGKDHWVVAEGAEPTAASFKFDDVVGLTVTLVNNNGIFSYWIDNKQRTLRNGDGQTDGGKTVSPNIDGIKDIASGFGVASNLSWLKVASFNETDAANIGKVVETITATAVPEPSAFGLLAGIGALALVASRRRRK